MTLTSACQGQMVPNVIFENKKVMCIYIKQQTLRSREQHL